jgi:hypothetical protein
MTAKKQKDTQHGGEKKPHNANEDALRQAEKDIEKDPELSDPDPTDDLDEGELARKDNSDEDAFDAFGK